VDDVTMGITHVIRGNDHLPNTPKQILCYEALDYPVPEFAHVSMILGPDRSRLSKRHGATSVQAFRDEGILADAMVNYLARLGWAHGDQEIFSRAELVELFDIKDVASSAAVFDRTKLEWLSQEYMKGMDGVSLARLALPFIEQAGAAEGVEIRIKDRVWLGRVMDTLKERAKTLVELARLSLFYFARPAYATDVTKKFLAGDGAERLDRLLRELEALGDFRAERLEILYRRLAAELGLKLVDLAQLTRVAVTGRTASPPLFEVLELLGKPETLERLRAARAAVVGGREP
jgi:glutamyl-tRNA synthetase